MRILFTDEQCVIGGASYPGIPLLIDDNNNIVSVASSWLRTLLVKHGTAASSVRQFAYHLKRWWTYLIGEKIAWDDVDDSVMIAWRDTDLSMLEAATANGYISTVFRMYLWAEQQGYVRDLIGQVDISRGFRPRLTAGVRLDRHGGRTLVSPLLKRTASKPVLPTPTHYEISRIHQALLESYHNNSALMIRDALILTWAELTGARRKEVLSLVITQIPPWDRIRVLEDRDEKLGIMIVGKGNKKRWLWIGVDLLTQTREYIEIERASIVRRWQSRDTGYKTPDHIFLSTKTGCKLVEDTISQRFAIAFRKANVKGSMHRVRARYLTDLISVSVESALEKFGSIPDAMSILLPVAENAGHTHVATLAPYLAAGQKRLLRMTDSERSAMATEKAIAAEHRLNAALTRLKSSAGLVNLSSAIESGSKKRIREAIMTICETHRVNLTSARIKGKGTMTKQDAQLCCGEECKI